MWMHQEIKLDIIKKKLLEQILVFHSILEICPMIQFLKHEQRILLVGLWSVMAWIGGCHHLKTRQN